MALKSSNDQRTIHAGARCSALPNHGNYYYQMIHPWPISPHGRLQHVFWYAAVSAGFSELHGSITPATWATPGCRCCAVDMAVGQWVMAPGYLGNTSLWTHPTRKVSSHSLVSCYTGCEGCEQLRMLVDCYRRCCGCAICARHMKPITLKSKNASSLKLNYTLQRAN